MSHRPTSTIVIADTETYALAGVALHNAVQRFRADDVIVFSDRADLWAGHRVEPIPKIGSIADYNRTILAKLPEKIATDFALIVQFDGFPINASSFTEAFFDYDYIGAPWPAALFPERGPTVGNGGFSLRSRRIIEAGARYTAEIDFETAEDVTLCIALRDRLEAKDTIRFAPIDLAYRFSVELGGGDGEPFGFHGLHLLPKLYRGNVEFLLSNLPDRCFWRQGDQLKHLRFGFAGLGDEANAALEARLHD